MLKGCNRMMSILAIGEVVENFEITTKLYAPLPRNQPRDWNT